MPPTKTAKKLSLSQPIQIIIINKTTLLRLSLSVCACGGVSSLSSPSGQLRAADLSFVFLSLKTAGAFSLYFVCRQIFSLTLFSFCVESSSPCFGEIGEFLLSRWQTWIFTPLFYYIYKLTTVIISSVLCSFLRKYHYSVGLDFGLLGAFLPSP